ncbi:MAG: DUF2269 family protein [Actinomycetota bacterium]
MTWYEFLKTAHVLLAILWVGGAITFQMIAIRILKEDPPARLVPFTRDTEAIGMKVFLPASLVLLIAGILMVLDSPGIDFTDAWIIIGLGGIVSTIVIGAGFLGPESGRLATLIEQKSDTDPEVVQRITRILLISRIDLVILLIVAANMVFKPGA